MESRKRSTAAARALLPGFNAQAYLDSAGVAKTIAEFGRGSVIFSQGDACDHVIVTRDQITRSPAVIQRQPEPAHADQRSWEKEALIIGGSAGAGSGIGAVAGGKKGPPLARPPAASGA